MILSGIATKSNVCLSHEQRHDARFVKKNEGSNTLPGGRLPSAGRSDLRGDYHNVALLLLLYTLQGIPMGFAAAVPLILKERGASFTDIALFSICNVPFSAKLFWAPLVDSMYSTRIGRRKTWLVPMQLLIGVIMFYVAYKMPLWLGEGLDQNGDPVRPDVVPLTVCFLMLYFCCATQDIAVDGWALTILKPRNIGYASTCNTIGQTLGYFEAFVLIMAVVETGYVSFSVFTTFHGILFIFVTVCVLLFKEEDPVRPEEKVDDAKTVYMQMAQTVELPAVKELLFVLLTWKFSSAVAENVTILKVQELGMPKEHAATLSLLLMPLQIVIPMVVTKYTASDRPLDLGKFAYLPKTVVAAFSGFVLVYFAPVEAYKEAAEQAALVAQLDGGVHAAAATAAAAAAGSSDGSTLLWKVWPFYLGLLLLIGVYSVLAAATFVSSMAFYARVSDKRIGGTYMTLLNTCSNLGALSAKILVTYGIDVFTWRQCKPITAHPNAFDGGGGGAAANSDVLGACAIASGEKDDPTCTARGGECVYSVDGYYIVLLVCFTVGVAWWVAFKGLLDKIQRRSLEDWRVSGKVGSFKWLIAIFCVVLTMLLPALKKVFGA